MSEEFNTTHVSTPSPFQIQVTPSIQPSTRKPIGTCEAAPMPTQMNEIRGPAKEITPVRITPSVEELERQKKELEKQIAERHQAEKMAVINQIVDVAAQYQVTIEDLIEAMGGFKPKRKGVKATAKYRDPSTGITWSGRGKEPTWLRGHDRNTFLIKDE